MRVVFSKAALEKRLAPLDLPLIPRGPTHIQYCRKAKPRVDTISNHSVESSISIVTNYPIVCPAPCEVGDKPAQVMPPIALASSASMLAIQFSFVEKMKGVCMNQANLPKSATG